MEKIPEKDKKDEKMEGEGENSEDEITPAKVFNDQILKRAGLGESAGDFIA